MDNKIEGRLKVKKIARNLMPICYINEESLLCYRRGNLITLDTNNYQVRHTKKIKIKLIRELFGFSSILTRRFGLNSIKGAMIDENRVLLSFTSKFMVYDLLTDQISIIPENNMNGSNGTVLHFAKTSHGLMWGDYGYNPHKKSMGIYCLNSKSCDLERVWKFAEGEINHVHNIVEDKITKRIWIFTGDFEDSAAIYYTDDFFHSLTCAIKGNQFNRSCIGMSSNNRLIYASDSSNENCNGIYKFENGEITKICDINGSAIYGYSIGDKLVFSTTVENQSDEFNNFKNKYKYNLGQGIKDWYVEVVEYNADEGSTKVLLRKRKDILPMIPYLYGCFRFPSNGNNNKLILYGQAVRTYDQYLIECKI